MKKFPLLKNIKICYIDWNNVILLPKKPDFIYTTNVKLVGHFPKHNSTTCLVEITDSRIGVYTSLCDILCFDWLYNDKIINNNIPYYFKCMSMNNYIIYDMINNKKYDILKNKEVIDD
jgi:hypothetical protein